MKKQITVLLLFTIICGCNNKNDRVPNEEPGMSFWEGTMCVRNKVPELSKILTLTDTFPFLGNNKKLNKVEFKRVIEFLGHRLKEVLSKSYIQTNIVKYNSFHRLFEDIYFNVASESVVKFKLEDCIVGDNNEGEMLAGLSDSFIAMLNTGPNYDENKLNDWFLSLNKKGEEYKYQLFWVLVSMAAAEKYDDMEYIIELFSRMD